MPYREQTKVISSKQLATGVYELILGTADIASAAKPGQFVSVYSNDGARLLPRPISICGINVDVNADDAGKVEINKANNSKSNIDKSNIRLVYRIAGAGTLEFSGLKAGDTVTVQGPLGNGYDLDRPSAGKRCVLFGGGIGIPPMLELAKQLDCEKSIVLGYRDKETFLADEFREYGNLYIATEDGSVGVRGNVLDAVREYGIDGEVFYACGPMPMLRAIKAYAAEHDIECYISLEEKMACGIGACLACVCKTKNIDEHSKVNNARICAEGPVFDAREVEI